MKEYTFIIHWLSGMQPQTVKGWGAKEDDAKADAFRRAGYGNGALRAVDYIETKKA